MTFSILRENTLMKVSTILIILMCLVYFIKQGKIKLYYDLNLNEPDLMESFNLPFIAYVEGSYFGDSDIFIQDESNAGRDGTAMADSEVHLLVLGKKDLNAIMEEFEEMAKEMKQIAKERKANHEKLIENIKSEFKKVYTDDQFPNNRNE